MDPLFDLRPEDLNPATSAPTASSPNSEVANKIEAARERITNRLIEKTKAQADLARELYDTKQLQNANKWGSLGTNSDTIREITAGGLKGLGSIPEFGGYVLEGLGADTLGGTLGGVGKGMANKGNEILESRKVGTRGQVANSQMTGDFFDPSSWDFGSAPSFSGYMSQIVPTLAEMAPQIATLLASGAPGVALAAGVGFSQAANSQGNAEYDTVMGQSEAELMEGNERYRSLRETNPEMTHEAAIREAADTAKAVASIAGGIPGAFGGVLARALWKGPGQKIAAAKNKVQRARELKVGPERLQEMAKKRLPTSSVIRGTAERGALGFAAEGLQEVSETVITRAATNLALGADQDLDKDTLADFVLGGIAGGTISGVAGGTAALKAKLVNRDAAKREREDRRAGRNAEAAKAIATKIDNGAIDELVDPANASKYKPADVAAGLTGVLKSETATKAQKDRAREGISELMVTTEEARDSQQEILDMGVEAYYNESIDATKSSLQLMEDRLKDDDVTAEQKELLEARIPELKETIEAETQQRDKLLAIPEKKRVKQAKADIAEYNTQLASMKVSQTLGDDAVRPDDDQDSSTALDEIIDTETTPEEKSAATSRLVTRAATDPDALTDEQIDLLYSATEDMEDLPDEMREAITDIKEIRQALKDNPDLGKINSRIDKEDRSRGFGSVNGYRAKIKNAVSTGEFESARTTLGSVDDYRKQKENKAQAAQEAIDTANETGKEQIIIQNDDQTFTVRKYNPIKDIKSKIGTGSLTFKPNASASAHQLVEQIRSEANFLNQNFHLLETMVNLAESVVTGQAPRKASRTGARKKIAFPGADPTQGQFNGGPNTATRAAGAKGATRGTAANTQSNTLPPVPKVPASNVEGTAARKKLLTARFHYQKQLNAKKKDKKALKVAKTIYEKLLGQVPGAKEAAKGFTPTAKGKSAAKGKSTGKGKFVKKKATAKKRAAKKTPAKKKQTPEEIKAEIDKKAEFWGKKELKTGPGAGTKVSDMTQEELSLQLHGAYVDAGEIQERYQESPEDVNETDFAEVSEDIKNMTAYLFRGPEYAPLRELMTKLNSLQGMDQKDLMAWAYKHGDPKQPYRNLLVKMVDTDLFNDAPVVTMAISNSITTALEKAAAYSPTADNIRIAPKAQLTDLGKEVVKQTQLDIIHELLHPYYERALQDPEFKKEVVRMIDVAKKWNKTNTLEPELQRQFDYAVGKHLPKADAHREFLPTIMGSPELLQVVKEIRDPDHKEGKPWSDLVRKFVDFVTKIIDAGYADMMLLGSILEATDLAIENRTQDNGGIAALGTEAELSPDTAPAAKKTATKSDTNEEADEEADEVEDTSDPTVETEHAEFESAVAELAAQENSHMQKLGTEMKRRLAYYKKTGKFVLMNPDTFRNQGITPEPGFFRQLTRILPEPDASYETKRDFYMPTYEKALNEYYRAKISEVPKIDVSTVKAGTELEGGKFNWSVEENVGTEVSTKKVSQTAANRIAFSLRVAGLPALKVQIPQRTTFRSDKPGAKLPTHSVVETWSVLTEVEGKLYLVDQPQSELMGPVNHAKRDEQFREVTNREFTPRFIPYTVEAMNEAFGEGVSRRVYKYDLSKTVDTGQPFIEQTAEQVIDAIVGEGMGRKRTAGAKGKPKGKAKGKAKTATKTSGITLTGKGKYLAKDQAKADKANKYIGQGVENSSTAQYAEDYGDQANTGEYTSEDVVFVSTNGKRKNRLEFDQSELQLAIDADATIITDKPADRAREFNIGEREVAQFLTEQGYTEKPQGTWTRAAEPVEQLSDEARTEAEEAIKAGTRNMFSFELEEGSPGPMMQGTDNMVKGNFQLKHNRPLGYSPQFMDGVFAKAGADIQVLAPYLENAQDSIAKLRRKEGANLSKYVDQMMNHVRQWRPMIQAHYKEGYSKEKRMSNLIEYFADEAGIDTGIADAIAVGTFRYTAEKHNDLYWNGSDKERAGVLGLSERASLSPEVSRFAATAGVRQNTAIYDIGRHIYQTLGMRPDPDAPTNYEQLVIGELGARGLALLLEQGYVQQHTGFPVEWDESISKIRDWMQGTEGGWAWPDTATLRDPKKLKTHMAKIKKFGDKDKEKFMAVAAQKTLFIRSNRTWKGKGAARELGKHKDLEAIKEAAEGTREFLDSVFGTDKPDTYPVTSLEEAVSEIAKKNNTRIDVSKTQQEIIQKASQIPHTLQQGMARVLGKVHQSNPEFMGRILGVVPDDTIMHIDDDFSVLAKNEAKLREIDKLFEHMDDVLEGDITKPFYILYDVWSNERVGMASNGFNSQASHLHRAFHSSPDWEFEVNPLGNSVEHGMFKFALAQSLGESVDKMDAATAAARFNELLENEHIQAALPALFKAQNQEGYEMSQAEQDLVVAALENNLDFDNMGKEGPQFLRGLFELAKYTNAVETGGTFKTDLSAEADGRASGPTINLLQMGMLSPDADFFMQLGGVFVEGSNFSDAGEAVQQTQSDIYKMIISESMDGMVKSLQKLKDSLKVRRGPLALDPAQRKLREETIVRKKEEMKLMKMVLGDIVSDEGVVSGMGRNLVKEPITANFFMAGELALQRSMGNEFVAHFRNKVVELARDGEKKKANKLIKQFNKLLDENAQLAMDKTGDYSLQSLSRTHENALYNAMASNLGVEVSTAIEAKFEHNKLTSGLMLDGINMVANQMKAFYDARKRQLVQAELDDAKRNGNTVLAQHLIEAAREGKAQLVHRHELSMASYEKLEEEMAQMFPWIHTPTSLADANAKAGITPFKSRRGRSAYSGTDAATGEPGVGHNGKPTEYTGLYSRSLLADAIQPVMANGQRDVEKTTKTGKKYGGKGIKSIAFTGTSIEMFELGVGAIAKTIHSMDSSAMMPVYSSMPAINAHDGVTTGAMQLAEAARIANENWFDTMLNYSVTEQLLRTMYQSLDTLNARRGEVINDPVFQSDIKQSMPMEYDPDQEKTVRSWRSPDEFLFEVLKQGAKADKARLQMMSRIERNDQYYWPGVDGHPGSVQIISQEKRDEIAKMAEASNLFDIISDYRPKGATTFPMGPRKKGAAKKAWLLPENAPKISTTGQITTDQASYKRSWAERTDKAIFDASKIDRSENMVPNDTKSPIYADYKKIASKLAQTNGRVGPAIDLAFPTKGDEDITAKKNHLYAMLADNEVNVLANLTGTKLQRLRNWRKAYEQGSIDTENGTDGLLYSPSRAGPTQYTTQELFDALAGTDIPAEERRFLKMLLSEMSAELYDNSGILPGLTTAEMGETLEELALAYAANKMGEFGSSALRNGISLEPSQVFVMEQVELTMQSVLRPGTVADKELIRLYQQTKQTMNEDGRDFYEGADWAQATDTEKAQAKAAYDLVFAPSVYSANARSSHLSRFVAMALVHPQLRDKLVSKPSESRDRAPGETLAAMAERLFVDGVRSLGNLTEGVNPDATGVQVLEDLAKKLALNEHKRRMSLLRGQSQSVEAIEKMTERAIGKLSEKAAELINNKAIKESGLGIVRLAGEVVESVAKDRVDALVLSIEDMRDSAHRQKRLGFIGNIINDIQGETDENRAFYEMLSAAKAIEQERKFMADKLQQNVLNNFATPSKLTKKVSSAATQIYLRNDLSALLNHGYDTQKIHTMVLDTSARKQRVDALKQEISAFDRSKDFIIDSHLLARQLATGEVSSDMAYQNSYSIANQLGIVPGGRLQEGIVSDVPVEEADAAMPLIDELVSLLALNYTPTAQMEQIQDLVQEESARGDKDAFEYILGIHRRMQEDAQESLFEGDPIQMIKGYVRENYNPHNTVEFVTDGDIDRKEKLEQGGFEFHTKTGGDPTLVGAKKSSIYIKRGVGLADRETGALMSAQAKSRGTRFGSETPSDNKTFQVRSRKVRARNKARKNINPMTYIAQKPKGTLAAPVFRSNGTVSSFRYEADHNTKDTLFDRDNRVEAVLGATMANHFNKEQGAAHNRKMIQLTKDFYDADYQDNPDKYIKVSLTSDDAKARESYRLLDSSTRKMVDEIWGSKPMMIRKDVLDLTLGYRHLTSDEVFNKVYEKINRTFSIQIIEALLGPAAANIVRRAHDHWVQVVGLIRDTVVIRNLTTLRNNILSNVTTLFLEGVSPVDLFRGHIKAMDSLVAYQKVNGELFDVKARIAAATPGTNTAALERRAKALQFELDRNPAKELIDAGMFQTIQDDVDLDKSTSAYQSDFDRIIEQWSNKLPPGAQQVGRIAFVAQSTKLYKALAKSTQASDFIARYVLNEHLKKKQAKAKPADRMPDAKRISIVRQAFINYDAPSSQALQYLNDVGLLRFTKYFLRVQKQIARNMKERPARIMSLYLAEQYNSKLPTVLDSAALPRLGNNPIEPGALDIVEVADEGIVLKTLSNLW